MARETVPDVHNSLLAYKRMYGHCGYIDLCYTGTVAEAVLCGLHCDSKEEEL